MSYFYNFNRVNNQKNRYMTLAIENLIHRKPNEIERGKDYPPIHVPEILRSGVNLCARSLFMARFNEIPDTSHEKDIDCKKAVEWFSENHQAEIWDTHFSMRYLNENQKKAELDDVFYFLYEDLIVNFDTAESTVRFLFRKTPYAVVDRIAQQIKKMRERKHLKPEISIIVRGRIGLDVQSLDLKKTNLKLSDNYNENFKEVHEIILRRLKKQNDKGLVILHGKPGTGKTSYIRYLTSVVKKNIIFMPPNMASMITNPDLITLLIGSPNSILIIEDAENIVIDRERDGQSPVSALLNLSDGLLSDCLNIQIICSFNTDISKVDKALLRKGRLIANYEFKELELEKTRRLSEKLGFASVINEPMTLADIYNQEDKSFSTEPQRAMIGFRSGR